MNPKLREAVTIFKDLGWEKATPDNILDLPTGTPEQRKLALEGLKSGQLGGFVVDGSVHQWKKHFNVSLDALVLFAIRIGVTPSRAKTMLNSTWNKKYDDAKIQVIASRGEKFAAALVDAWFGNNSRGSFMETPVRLVYEMDLAIPQKTGYIEDWAWLVFMADDMRPDRWIDPGRKWLTPDMAKKRFQEHIQAGLELNVPITGSFGTVALSGIRQGLVDRDALVPRIFSALDAAIRPSDRRAIIEILDELNITDEEIAERVQALIPILATSDNTVINRFAPTLIAHAAGDLLTEVMLSAFSSTTKKTRLLVLKAAQSRSCPLGAEVITPWLTMLAADKDKSISAAALKLMEAWSQRNRQAV